MGKEFIALIDVIPDDTEKKLDDLVDEIKNILPDTCTLEHYEILPVAFGLKKVRARIRYPEEWGGTDKLEEIIKGLDGLQGVEGIAFSKA